MFSFLLQILHLLTWDTADLRMAKVGYILHGIALYLMVSHSFACHCIVSYGIAWYCIISYGIAWYCIVGFGARAVSRKTPIYFILAAEITQVLDSIAWVRCAPGNVLMPISQCIVNDMALHF